MFWVECKANLELSFKMCRSVCGQKWHCLSSPDHRTLRFAWILLVRVSCWGYGFTATWADGHAVFYFTLFWFSYRSLPFLGFVPPSPTYLSTNIRSFEPYLPRPLCLPTSIPNISMVHVFPMAMSVPSVCTLHELTFATTSQGTALVLLDSRRRAAAFQPTKTNPCHRL